MEEIHSEQPLGKEEMSMYLDKAGTLIEALPYIQHFQGATIVVKYGGSAMVDENLKRNVIQDVALLKLVGFRPIIVHGGGKDITKMLGKVGKTSEFKAGFRVTDDETMDVVEMVLNRINKSLVSLMEKVGVKACGVSGKDGSLLQVSRKMPDGEDIGYVGDIECVNTELLDTLLDNDFVPVVCPIGFDADYHSYNINADDAACAIAAAMHAEKLAFLTDVEGVYKDFNDKSSLITTLSIEQAQEMMDAGELVGGMLPKIQNCIDAMKKGVNRVHILDGRVPHCLLLEIFTNQGIGTMIEKSIDAWF